MNNGDLPAMPIELNGFGQFAPVAYTGLTKREAMMMRLLPEVLRSIVSLAEKEIKISLQQEKDLVIGALQLVDVTLAELERTK